MEITINYWAVLVAAIVNMAVGALWYGPLFGKKWRHLMGLTKEDMKHMRLTPLQSMCLGLITALIMAYVLGYFALLIPVSGIAGAWQLAFLIWLGFLATTSVGSFIWEGKSIELFLLNAGEQLVALFLMVLVLVLW